MEEFRGKILVMDDDRDSLNLLREILSHAHYEVVSAWESRAAVSAAQKHSPNLILLDIRMPLISGYEVCSMLKSDERTRDIPVIFVSVLDDPEYKLHAFSLGAVDYITKPFYEAEVLARVGIQISLQNAQKSAQEATRAKNSFIAHMSHEIRTQINPILNMTRLLLESRLTSEQREYAEIIASSSGVLLSLINDILDFSKVEAGKMELESIDFDIRLLLQEIGRMMSWKIEEKGLALHLEHSGLGACTLRGDPNRLRQMLLNLLQNALKFTERGEVRLDVSCTQETDGEAFLRFAVGDSGIGIPQDRLASIFEPFSQADASTTRKFGGTGLGLAISRQLVEAMGGRIDVESEEGRGTTFRFALKFPKAPVRAVPDTSQKAKPDSTVAPSDAKILLAEDDSVNQKVALALLKKFGLGADVASNGREAFEKAVAGNYDLVLMDIQMPEVDGCEATRNIREWEAAHSKGRTPIIAMTAHAMKGVREILLQAGMDDYVAKPIEPGELYAAIAKRLHPEKSEETQTSASPSASSGNGAGEADLEIFDPEDFWTRIDSDRPLAKEIQEAFLTQFPLTLRELRDALALGQTREAASFAHSLRGIAGCVSSRAIMDKAMDVEKILERNERKEAEPLLDLIERDFEALSKSLERALADR